MIRIAALNDSSSEDDSRAQRTPARRTKEAKESEAFTLYDEALRLQRHGEVDLAETAFKDLLNHGFLRETANLIADEEEGADQDGLRLLYSIHKNLAGMALHRGDLQSAIWSYVEAVKIDTTEVTVWYKIGTIALKLYNFPLARLGFEKGLHCNPNHWPCLDHVITLLYAMNDYWNCLYYISQALEKDSEYTKGLVLRKQILKEHPSLKYDTDEMFDKCDPVVLLAKVDPSESEEYINEALDLRDRRRELAKEPDPLPIKLTKPITHFTWKNLGESLVELYDRAKHSDPPLSLGLRVDLSEYSNCTDRPSVLPGPCKSPIVEEASNNSGEMEVDSVPVDTNETKSTEDRKRNENDTFETDNVQMITEDPAAPLDSQREKDHVAMDTGDAQDKKKVISSLMPSVSLPIMQSSPLSTVVSQAKITDLPKVKADVSQCNKTDSPIITADMSQCNKTDSPIITADMSQCNKTDSPVITADVSQCNKTDSPIVKADVSQCNKTDSPVITADVSQCNKTDSPVITADVDMPIETVPTSLQATTSIHPSTNVSESQEFSSEKVPSLTINKEKQSLTSSLSELERSSDVSELQEKHVLRLSPINTSPEIPSKASQLFDISEPPQTTPLGDLSPSILSGLPQSCAVSETQQISPVIGMSPTVSTKSVTETLQITTAVSEAMETEPFSEIQGTNVSGIPQMLSSASLPATLSGTPSTLSSGMLAITSISGILQTTSSGLPPTTPVLQSLPVSGISCTTPISEMQQTVPISEMPHTTPVSGLPHTTPISGMPHSAPISGLPHTSPISGIPHTTPISGLPHTTPVSGIPHTTPISGIPHTTPISGLPHTTPVSGIPHTTPISGLPHTTLISGIPHTTPVSAPMSGLVHTPVTELSYTVPTMSTPTSPLSTPGLHQTPTITALHDHTCAAPVETEDLGKGRGKAPKRKRGFIPDDFGLSVKRRSARVRNVSKPKEEPSVNFEELLISFLPSSLKQTNEDDDTEMLVTQEQEQSVQSGEEKTTGGNTEPITEAQKLTTTEDTEVREFLKENIKNGGTICLMLGYLFALAKHGDTKWPSGLTDIYLKVYSRTRKHFDLPDIFSLSDSEEYTQNLGKTCQLAAEFQLDQWIVNNRMTLSPGSSPRSPGSQQLQTSDLPSHCNDDLWFITGLTGCGEVMGANWLPHCIRVYWMKSRFYMLQGKMDDALYCFQKTLEYLEYSKKQGEPARICLVNCKMDRIISIDQVKSHQESLHRCQSLEETQKLYESGNYEKVVDFILQTFTQPQLKGKTVAFSAAIPERQSQLLLLQDSLFKMEAHKKGVVWGEVSFNEAVQCYRKATTTDQRDAWSATLSQICQNLIRILVKREDVLKDIPNINLVRLSRNLISIIDITMAAPDSAVEMPIGTVLPWILLYKLIKFEEDKIRSMQVSTLEAGHADLLDGMPSYLMLLNIAHEYLARHSWCTKSDGSLLLFYLDVAQEFLSGSYQFKHDLEQSYEQCVYCLFGHPNKKGRARHLMDHNAAQIDLTWDSAQKIFEYFKPNSVPEFDSYKADAVSADVEFLLKRIAQLVPDSEKPAKLMENLQDYIEGNTNIPPTPDTKHLSTVSKELYYLLADYYFKNKEQAKAVRFYMSDICMNPTRLDSWAGMGLARMSQLEQKLSSTALKMDMPIYRKSIGALRCFRRAVEIDDSNAKLWIEYGSLAYQLHSHASRQLKWKNWFPLTEELEQIASDSRQEMLQTAFNCYKKASECESDENEEEWLQHYMMAKCLEKMRKPPKEYLDHYKKAAEYLYEENATFPKKIVYAYTTPHLAVESLEMFYRIHVSIMKILLKNKTVLESDMQLFQHYITQAADSPFARCQEKRQEVTTTLDGSVLPVGQGSKSGGKKSKVMSMDHTYSKQKNTLDGSGTGSVTSDLDQAMTSKPGTMVTHREVKVIDSSNAAGSMMELSAEHLDEHLTKTVKKEEVTSAMEKSAVSAEQGQGDTAVVDVSEGDCFFLDEVTGIVKQTSFGFDVQGDTQTMDKGDGANIMTETKEKLTNKTNDKPMEVCNIDDKSSDNIMDVSLTEDKLLSEDKLDEKKLEKDDDLLSKLDEDALLSDSLPQEPDIQTFGEDKKSHDIISLDKTPDTKSSPHKEADVDGQEDEKSYHSDVRELSQGNESMESETRQYGDMNLSEDQEAGPPIDPSELSLSKGLRERMAQELEGDLMSKSEQGPSTEGLGTDSKSRKDEKSVDSLSDDDEMGESLDDSFLSDSFDSIPDTLGSPSRSVVDSLSKSGDSLSKSGGFLAQFNQFLSKNIIPDDIISESSPEKSLSSPMKASRSQSPSSQILISDADIGLKVSSQHDTISSISVKEDVTSLSSNLSSKQSTQHDSTNQNQDNNDTEEKHFETVSANQNSDKKKPLPVEEKFKDGKQPMESGVNKVEGNMEVDQIKDLDDGKKEDSGDNCVNKEEEGLVIYKTENPSQNLGKSDICVESTTSERVDNEKTDVNESKKEDNEKMDDDEIDPAIAQGQKVEYEKMDIRKIATSMNQEQKADNMNMEVSNIPSTDKTGQKDVEEKMDVDTIAITINQEQKNKNMDVSNTTNTDMTEQKDVKEKMDVDNSTDNHKSMTDDCHSSKSASKEDVTSAKETVVKSKDSEGITPSVDGKIASDGLTDQITKEKESNREVTEGVKKGSKKDKTGKENTKSKGNDRPGSSKMHKQLIEQCMAALCLCLARFPTHYKSLYRLAYTYIHSPYHKNLQYAHDLLLGNPDWKMMAHMPAQGLFVDRKPNNFFQGVWKIPVDEIDRSGSFPSHLTRSVKLLLKVLKEQKDVPKLHSIFLQLNRDPDPGKKYMRDAERVKFARLAHQYCLDAIRGRLPELRQSENHTRAIKCLMEVYKVYNYISFKMDISQTIEANELLEDTFSAVMGKKVQDDEEVLEQAIRFCQEEVQRHKARQYQPPVGKPVMDTPGKDGSQSDSSFFSPEKPVSIPGKIGGQNQVITSMAQGSKALEKDKKSPVSPFQQNSYKTISGPDSSIGTLKQPTGKPGSQGLGQGKPTVSGISKIMQKASPSTQKPSVISTVMANIPKEKIVGEAKSKSLPLSGKGASGFKPYNPMDSSAPSPVITPATPHIGLSPKFDLSKKADPAKSQPVKKVIEVIEISSSDDESDAKSSVEKSKGALPVPKVTNPVQKGAARIEMSGSIGPSQKGENLRTLLQGGEYQSMPQAGIISPGSKGAAQPKGGNLHIQRPYPTGIVYNKGSQDMPSNRTKQLQRPVIETGGQRGNNSTGHKFAQPTSQEHPGSLLYGAKVMAPSHQQKPSSSSQESITDDSDLSEKDDKTYEPSDESSSDEEQFGHRNSKGKSQSTSHSAGKSSKYNVKAATSLQDIEPIRILNAETGQIVDSDSQKSDLVTDPEKLFFDVKDWLEDL